MSKITSAELRLEAKAQRDSGRCLTGDLLGEAAAALEDYEKEAAVRAAAVRVEAFGDAGGLVARFEIVTLEANLDGDELLMLLNAANRGSHFRSYRVKRRHKPNPDRDAARLLAPLAPASDGEWHEPEAVEYRAERSVTTVLDFKIVCGTLPTIGESTPPLRPFVRFAPDSLLMRKVRLADAVLAWEAQQATSPLWKAVTHPTFRDQVLEAIADVRAAHPTPEARDA